MPNIIKASQVDSNSPRSVCRGASPADPAELLSAPAETVQDQHHAIVNDALNKAKNIMEATQNYSLQQLRESATRMNEECAERKLRGYQEGYRQGEAQGKQSGYDAGYTDGYAQGVKQAHQEAQQTIDELMQMIQTVEQKGDELFARYEGDLESLAVAVAQKIIRRELNEGTAAMQSIIQSVLDSYRDVAWVTITVAPSAARQMTKSEHGIVQALQNISQNVKVIENPGMSEGDCVIDLPDRRIDAGVDSQMGMVKMALGL